MSRIMTFETITDNRFDDNIFELCENNAKQIKANLEKLLGVICKTNEMTIPHFPDGTQQARIRFYVQKIGRQTTWNDVYKAINMVKSAPYKFI